MMAEIEIAVTEQDLLFAVPRHFFRCPIALALTRYFGKGASVNLKTFHLRNHNEDYPLPKIAIYRRDCYDATGKMAPFSFTVSIPIAAALRSKTTKQ